MTNGYILAMGIENRDWYRDWWRKKTGYVERASFRVPSRVSKRQAWHWSLLLVLWTVLVLVFFTVFRLVSRWN